VPDAEHHYNARRQLFSTPSLLCQCWWPPPLRAAATRRAKMPPVCASSPAGGRGTEPSTSSLTLPSCDCMVPLHKHAPQCTPAAAFPSQPHNPASHPAAGPPPIPPHLDPVWRFPTWRSLLHQLPSGQHQQLVAVHDGVWEVKAAGSQTVVRRASDVMRRGWSQSIGPDPAYYPWHFGSQCKALQSVDVEARHAP